MRFSLGTLILMAFCIPAIAEPLTSQGSVSVFRGRAHVVERALGTYVEIQSPNSTRSVSGYIPFGDGQGFRGIDALNGRSVQLTGVLLNDGEPLIVMTDARQLKVID